MSDPEVPPDVKQAVPVEAEPSAVQQETITEPAKLLRIASMVRELLEETRQASLDESGRKRLADVYQRSVQELGASISPDLQEELAALAPPVGSVPSESEIRIAQAQLVCPVARSPRRATARRGAAASTSRASRRRTLRPSQRRLPRPLSRCPAPHPPVAAR